MLNEAFGWSWIVLGFLAGGLLGTGFERDGFLGGYDSLRRRLLRLGHIAMIALGVLNILFVISLERWGFGGVWVDLASWSLMAGALLMPSCCALTACVPRAKPFFALPIVTLVFGASVTSIGLGVGALS